MTDTMLRRISLALLAAMAVLGACSSDDGEDIPQTEFLAVRRAWRPGERDSVVADAIANNSFLIVIPGYGAQNLSSQASVLVDPDSTSDIVVNPNYIAPSNRSPFGPSFSVAHTLVPGAGWSSTGLKVVLNGPDIDNNWLGVFWYNNTDQTRKGLILAGTAAGANTLATTTVNSTVWDASFGVTGVSAGEANPSNGNYYENRGEGGTYRVISTTVGGGFNTITSGPFTGGTLRIGTQNEVINNVIMTRRVGSAAPASVTASLSGTITAWEMICNFPTPCTTNVPGLAEAARRGPLPDSLFVKLPWIAAMPPERQAQAVRAYAAKRLVSRR